VSSTFVQPFASYNFGQGWSVTFNTESSYDWTDDKLTVPVNLVMAKVFEIGDQAMSLWVGGRYYAIKPEGRRTEACACNPRSGPEVGQPARGHPIPRRSGSPMAPHRVQEGQVLARG